MISNLVDENLRNAEVSLYQVSRDPLGRATGAGRGSPLPGAVADILTAERVGGTKWSEVHHAASEFIEDWDNGRIRDLASALGVGSEL